MAHTPPPILVKRAGALPVLLAVLLAGCGSAARPRPRPATPTKSASAPTVAITDYAYRPQTLTVPAGTAVTFVNHDQTAHTATASGQPPAFDTGTLASGQSKRIVLSKPGTYTYQCQFHPFMRATITVTRH